MILMGGKRKGMLALIMKKMTDHDSLKKENAENYEKMEQVPNKDGAESDYSNGLDASAEKVMESLKTNDVSSFKQALKSFIEMAIKDNN